MTWRVVIAKVSGYLSAKQVPEPLVAAELLAARLLNLGRGELAMRLGDEVAENYLEALRRAMARLAKGEPIQYVLGEWDFRSLTLKCDRRALIPRPETEELVTRALAWLKSREWQQPPFVVDVGTGTGAIILSLAKEFEREAIFLGTDVSEEAIALAKINAERCGLKERVRFSVADGMDDFDEPESLDMIISNPPYIPSAVCDGLDPRIINFEPRLALDGGGDGLQFYDRYLSDALNLLKPGGAVFFEIGDEQGPALRKLMGEYGFANIRIEQDFSGHDRYAFGEL